ncbi:DUF6138 family protein [uncultured Fusobacterium sp.]|uniref:DUF6138 family protein n=1 Tax=uncultured Fusobacterium sp. TaxID=159267 RepID=UPI0025FD2FBD|nr:DUF6138 family protein [uncultured Fusobacterium sp.]
MENKVKTVTDKMIEIFEFYEKEIREVIEKEETLPEDKFMPGWAKGIHFSWYHHKAQPEYDAKESNEITCFFEFNGIHVSYNRMKEQTDIDLKFLTSEIFKDEIVPTIQKWLQGKVDNESYGGLYNAFFGITMTLSVSRDPLPTDAPHMQGQVWEQTRITAKDEKRLNKRKELIYNFIKNKEYKTTDISEIDNSLVPICSAAVQYFLEEFGRNYLIEFFTALIEQAKKSRFSSTMTDLIYGFANGAAILTQVDESHTPNEEELALACWLSMMLLIHGTDKYERQYGRDYLKKAGELGYKEAKNILKFGTGQIPADIVQYKDKYVTCLGNDIDKVIDLKIKEECEEAYKAMIEFIIRLIKAGFPNEYSIKFNSKVKEFLPIPDLKKTKANIFWNNCAKYPALYPLMKEYADTIMDSYDYYSDADSEEAVPVGGYAVFALGLADISNGDIVQKFMEQNDSEHSISPSWFVGEYIDKFGITPENIPVVIACLTNSNNHGYKGDNFAGLNNTDILSKFVEELENSEISSYSIYELIESIWGGEDELKEVIDEASRANQEYLQKILELSEEDED